MGYLHGDRPAKSLQEGDGEARLGTVMEQSPQSDDLFGKNLITEDPELFGFFPTVTYYSGIKLCSLPNLRPVFYLHGS